MNCKCVGVMTHVFLDVSRLLFFLERLIRQCHLQSQAFAHLSLQSMIVKTGNSFEFTARVRSFRYALKSIR